MGYLKRIETLAGNCGSWRIYGAYFSFHPIVLFTTAFNNKTNWVHEDFEIKKFVICK